MRRSLFFSSVASKMTNISQLFFLIFPLMTCRGYTYISLQRCKLSRSNNILKIDLFSELKDTGITSG